MTTTTETTEIDLMLRYFDEAGNESGCECGGFDYALLCEHMRDLFTERDFFDGQQVELSWRDKDGEAVGLDAKFADGDELADAIWYIVGEEDVHEFHIDPVQAGFRVAAV